MAFPIVAAGLYGVSALAKLFSSQSAARERKDRFSERLKMIEQNKQADILETSKLLNTQLQSRLSRAKQSGTRQALALGRMNEATSITAPITNRATTEFAGALERSIFNINQRARAETRQAQSEYDQSPIPYNAGDLFGDVTETAGSFLLQQSLLESTPTGQGTSTNKFYAPSTDVGAGSGVGKSPSGWYKRQSNPRSFNFAR
jgi:hypothetical protein